jgi:type VI secretion system protein ImpF
MIRQAVIDFEPRVLAESVQVKAVLAEHTMSRNAVAFQIEGELWGRPVSSHLYLRTEIDLDTGHVTISERPGPSG